MAGIWYYNGDHWVPVTKMYRGTGTGFAPLNGVWRQMGEDGDEEWLQIWERPNTPPPAPTLDVTLVTKTRNKFKVTVTTPDAVGDRKYRRVVVKVGIGTTPNPPDVNDGTYYTQKDDTEPWSEWFTDQIRDYQRIVENSTATKEFPDTFLGSVTVPLNTDVTFSAWVMDEYGNWSDAATSTIRTLKSTDTPYGGTVYKTALWPISWDAWAADYNNWLYQGKIVRGKREFPTGLDWVRDKDNPRWWTFQGGQGSWRTFLWYGNNLRMVLNAAAEVRSVKMPMMRRYDTSVNMSGGRRVNDADTYGPKTGVIFHVWAHTQSSFNREPMGTTTDGSTAIITGSDSLITTSGWSVGEVTTITIPEKTWRNFLDGAGGKARGLVFYHPHSTGTATDKYSISYALPAQHYGRQRLNKDNLAGYVIVEWVGYDGNPWPTADPSHPNFKPLGAPSSYDW